MTATEIAPELSTRLNTLIEDETDRLTPTPVGANER